MTKKVLIIDDEESVVKSVVRLFHADKDISLDAIVDTAELEAVLTKTNYDLILVDVMMPGIDGFEVVRRIQKYHRDPDKKILALSGNYPADGKIILESMGVFKCIDKPFVAEDFRTLIKDILNGYLHDA